MLRGSGRDQGDVRETTRRQYCPSWHWLADSPVAATEVPEAQSLLGWKVHHDEAIGAGFLCILQHLLFAVA